MLMYFRYMWKDFELFYGVAGYDKSVPVGDTRRNESFAM